MNLEPNKIYLLLERSLPGFTDEVAFLLCANYEHVTKQLVCNVCSSNTYYYRLTLKTKSKDIYSSGWATKAEVASEDFFDGFIRRALLRNDPQFENMHVEKHMVVRLIKAMSDIDNVLEDAPYEEASDLRSIVEYFELLLEKYESKDL